MEKNKFTQTEIKVLACFTLDNIKPNVIAKILNKSIRTVYAHLNQIKSKADVQTIGDITLFVRKSAEFKELQELFKNQYIDYFYRKTAKKIAHKLKELNIVCNIIISNKLTNISVIGEIANLIQLAGINVNRINQKDISDNLKEQEIYLFINQDMAEIQELYQQSTQNSLYLVLNKLNDRPIVKDTNILFYNTDNKKNFYKFLTDYLAKSHQYTIDSEEIVNFSSDVEHITNNIQTTCIENMANNKTNENEHSIYYYKYLIIVITFFILTGIGYFYINKVNNALYTPVNAYNIDARKSGEQWSWNLPLRNKSFTGREDVFKQIKENLDKSSIGIITQSIVGTGGIGKTQVTTEYVYRAIENKEYDVILWITSENQNSINNSYNIFANKLKINTHGLQPEQLRKIIHNVLLDKHKVKKILFVLDNVPKKEDIQQYLIVIHKHFPIDINPHILITSRSQHWNENALILDIFTEQESKTFIGKHLTNENEQNTIRLAKALHYFPLALGQSVGYIKQHTNIKDYLKLYQAKQQQYLDIKPQDTNQYKETLWKALSISLNKLSNSAKEILYISSYLEPDNIQLELFNNLPLENKSQVIKELRKHSFIILNNTTSFKIHRLLQQVIRLTIKNKREWLNKATEMADQAAKKFDKQNKKTWDIAKTWLYHIPTLSQYMPQNLDKDNMLHNYGSIAQNFALYVLAKSVYLSSLKIKESYYKNPNHIELADTLNDLGWVEHFLGNDKEAKNLLQRALKIKEFHYQDPMNIELTNILSNLGWVEKYLGKYEEAKNLLQRALKIKESHYQDPMNIELADVLKNLSWVEKYLGKYEESKNLLQRALKIKEFHYQDPMNIEFGSILHCLGWIEHCLGNDEEAKNLLQRALVIRESHYQDPMNIRIANTLIFLGKIEYSLGKYEEAKNLFQRALVIQESYYKNPNHIELTYTLSNLGKIEYSFGKYEEAKSLLQRTLVIRESHYQNPMNIDLADTLSDLGWVEHCLGNNEEAGNLLQQALKIKEFHYKDSNHIQLAFSLQNLGLIKENLGNYSTVLKYLNKSYYIWSKYYQNRLHEIMLHMYTPAKNWPKLSQNNLDKAIKHYQASLTIAKKLFGNKHDFVASHYYLLGQAYEINNKISEAVKQYKISLDIANEFEKTIGNNAIQAEYRKNIILVKNKLKNLSQKI